jgi:cytidylate kinase
VLRDEENLLRLFVYGDLDNRQERVAKRHPEIKSSQIIDVINKTDKRRATYYNFYTGNKWGKYDNYDIAVNSSTETVAYSDFESMIDAMSEFYSSKILTDGQNIKIV